MTLTSLEVALYASNIGVGIALLALAGFVLSVAPRSPQNRWLAAYFVILSMGWSLFDVGSLIHERTWNYDLTLAAVASVLAAPLAYLAFVGVALRTPLVRPLRSRAARTLIVVALALVAVSAFAFPRWWLDGPGTLNASGTWDWTVAAWLNTPAVDSFFALSYVIGIVATLHAWRVASLGSRARTQARAYAAAFLVMDVAIASDSLLLLAGLSLPYDLWLVVYIAQSLGILAGLGLLVRGLLRYQLFDFDLKVKWTLKRGTLVAIILGAFFVASALAEQYLQQFGWIIGGLAVGVLLFALRPIERAIDRMADRAMPKTTGTLEYLTQRKHEIYRAALEDMATDGAITMKERAALLRLAKNLGLDGNEAFRIESDVLAMHSLATGGGA